jgi:imidazole glycerol-phosphate synthase subunit HisH
MKSVTVIDYGIGNLLSVKRALQKVGFTNVYLAQTPKEIQHADRLVLPGVGAFENGMRGLISRNLIDPITEHAAAKKPLLGICLGMQLLGSESYEFGKYSGLDLIPGTVKKIPNHNAQNISHKVPYVGWAELLFSYKNHLRKNILQNTPEGSALYFVHSYHFVAKNKTNVIAKYNYNGMSMTAAIQKDNVVGLQFHPEKSGDVGLKILKTFSNI